MNPLVSRLSASRENEEKAAEKEARENEGKENKAVMFKGFADMNMFTMKSMDAYRMHLWGKMAAQYHWHQQQLQQQERQQNMYQHQQERQQLSGLAAGLRPSYFTSVSAGVLSGKASTSSSSSSERLPLANVSNTSDVHHPLLAALLSGKGSTALFSQSSGKEKSSSSSPSDEKEKERVRQVQLQREQQAQAAMLAAVASQTVLRRMGQAFWDAFSGSSSSPSPRGGQSKQNWDEDKVRRVLEGKAVVRVVDIEEDKERERKSVVPARNVSRGGSWSVPSSPVLGAAVPSSSSPSSAALTSKEPAGLTDSLEEKMRGLALGSNECPPACVSAACGGFVRRISRRD
ncbi:hypothetical protein EST38_g6905 [Candolleomyces aberdarensis]|uniref:Uncharacterized protein n=1 Tax=Candolleomyces aberdarensis TaxID=2316362 RepID=A0A4Q2DH11_9AGAR|nr:hypothetical protein EST38_g6905 [Candolleomyces aberdarensis]